MVPKEEQRRPATQLPGDLSDREELISRGLLRLARAEVKVHTEQELPTPSQPCRWFKTEKGQGGGGALCLVEQAQNFVPSKLRTKTLVLKPYYLP